MASRQQRILSVSGALFLTLGLVARICVAQEQDPAPSLLEGLRGGRPLVQLRARLVHIDEDAKPRYTQALNLRATVGWQTPPYYSLRLTAQAIHTDYLGSKRFNDDPSRGAASPYPLLPDPRNTDLNQLFVDYTGIADTRLRLGKQILRLDNQRFISDDDFRQTPRVFNGLSVVNTSLPRTELMLGHMQRVRNVLGQQRRLRLNILHASYNPAPAHSIAGYGYFHDQAMTGSNTGFPDNSHKVLGVRAEGSTSLTMSTRLLYNAEYAKQSRYSGGDRRIDAYYFRLGAGMSRNNVSVLFDHEVKGSNDGIYGFQTPLTDLYAFNGLALQFVTTPAQGLRDTWLTVLGQVGAFDLRTEYHEFRSDVGGHDFGRELDLGVTYPLRPDLTLRLQHAAYRPGDATLNKRDVEKTWLTLNYIY